MEIKPTTFGIEPMTGVDDHVKLLTFLNLTIICTPVTGYESTQRRSEDYTGMQLGRARFFTYYRLLALRRHCSVGFRCVYTSKFQEIQKTFIEKKIVKWCIFALCMERTLRFWVDTSFCVFTVCSLCVKTAFNLDSGKITL